MGKKTLSDMEKRQIIVSVLGANHSAAGRHFPLFSEMMTKLGYLNDSVTFAELIPALEAWLSGPKITALTSSASFAGILLFHFQHLVQLINANETGLRFYSYRAISYAITAWTYDKPMPSSSPQILANIRKGPITETQGEHKYNQVWLETVSSVTTQIKQLCSKKQIKEKNLRIIFKAYGKGRPEDLSLLILQSFEDQFSPISKEIWKSNYTVLYPQ